MIASAESTDSYVLDQFRSFRSLHTIAAEVGSDRWTGDAARMDHTCPNVAPSALDTMIFQTCGVSGANLHWVPTNPTFTDGPNRLNTWVYSSNVRDRLNLWVRH